MAGRPHALADPELAQKVAEAFVDGASRKDMCDIFNVTPQTITRWRRDPRVKGIVLKLIEDRILHVTRKVDSVIAQRLQSPEDMTTKELLEIRKEFLGGQLRAQTEKADGETVNQAMTWLDEHPEDAIKLQAWLDGTESHPVVNPE